jgi:hypothetical protein
MMIFTVFVFISTIKYCEAFIIETLTITSIYTMLYCSIKLDYDSKKEDIITIEKNDNIYNQIDIYRGQFEVGYTSYIKKFLNYLLHFTHDELLISFTVISTILSMIILYYILKLISCCCCYNRKKRKFKY